MKDSENGKRFFDIESDLENGLNMGLLYLERVEFLLNELVHRVEDYPGKDLTPNGSGLMILDLLWVNQMVSIAYENASNALSSFQDANKAFEELDQWRKTESA